jgi:hypothetical protein
VLKGHIHVLSFADISAGPGKHGHGTDFRIVLCIRHAEVLEGAGIEYVAGEDTSRHVPFRVDGRDTPAQAVIVHDIIMDEREGVGHLERKGSMQEFIRTPGFHRICCKHHHRRAEPFSPGTKQVGGGLVQIARLIDKIPVDHVIDHLCDRCKVR